MNRKLHIVCFDIPYPADYGGVIDVYYKLKSLASQGIDITLHCFMYGHREEQPALKAICRQVYYYPRKMGLAGISIELPFIVASRRNIRLLENLLLDDAPILFEGVHSTYYYQHPKLKSRFLYLRAHNIEHQYYNALFKSETNLFKRIYYRIESMLLKRYEDQLKGFAGVFPISINEMNYFQAKATAIDWIPAFHAHQEVKSLLGQGEYCLYQGNLSVSENEQAALFLIQNVFQDLDIPLVIAGRNPSSLLLSHASKKIKIIANPSEEDMQQWIQQAHIQVLYCEQASGIKLKLLDALYLGRFCIANEAMLSGTDIHSGILIGHNVKEFKEQITSLMKKTFTQTDLDERKWILRHWQTNNHAQRMINRIFPA